MTKLAALALVLGLIATEPAFAYIGPGAGLSAIGTLLAIVAAAVMAVAGFIWYPLKRLIRGKPAAPQPGPDKSEA
ncbi:MAG: hypothetical protein H6873_13580 [Hyphomicrobiaceae bacterium]|nr:hypothetical protein [Hyphomicrobiaceae bacterium]